ncbi:MAG: alpha/beta hydrolase [Pseudomonadota bacterium]
MATVQEGVFDSNGIKIRYVTAGQGEPIVLLHGWMSDASMWGNLETNPTAQNFQLIAVDLRGHGESGKPHNLEMYGAEMAEDVVRLLDHLTLDKAHLVGYSMGTIIAGKVAATHPDRVLSTVFGGQAPILSQGLKVDSDEVNLFATAVEEGRGLGSYLIAVSPADQPTLSLDQANGLAEIIYAGKDVKAFATAGRGIKHLDVSIDELERYKSPMLFIYGSEEATETKERAHTIVNELGRGTITVIEGADHMTTLTHPEFGKAMNEFLRLRYVACPDPVDG